MASATLQSILVSRPLEGLLDQLGVDPTPARGLFHASWRQLCRHAPLFGYADHPDVDAEHLEQAQRATHEQLAAWARQGDAQAVERAAVRAVLSALRSVRGLVAPQPRPELASLIEPAHARLCAAASCRTVRLVELFHYNRSLDRHYTVHRECFTELVDWCVTAIERAHEAPPQAATDGFTALVHRFVADARRLEPIELRPTEPRPGPELESELDPPRGEPDALPPAIAGSPPALAELVTASAPELTAEPGSSHPLVQRWYELLCAQLPALDDVSAEDVGTPRPLPPLVQSAVLVHVLGLENRQYKAVLSAAVDRLLVHRFIPAARSVGAKSNRHEPIAGLLVGVVGATLRPWSFAAPPLSTAHRVVLIALLAELATSKARKLLHEEKRHAEHHDQPGAIRAAVNRALARWPGCVHEASPKQRIDRVAAGLRYLGRVRRGTDPRARDAAIVAELLGH